MFVSDINLFSLLIPLFMLGLGSIILALHTFQKIPSYFFWYAFSSITASISLIIFNVINPSLLPQISFLPTGILLIAFTLGLHAIHLRLGLKSNWYWSNSILIFAIGSLCYFTFIHELYVMRMLTLTVAICLIWGYNTKALLQLLLPQKLDRWLRIFAISVIVIAIFRSVFLFTLLGATNQLLSSSLVLASTQLIVFFSMIILAILLYGSTYQDILMRLQQERSTDPLTGLLNRRAIYEYLADLQADHSKQHAIILCDIDHFKKINDVYGHHVGDLALQHVTKLLSDKIRHHDRISRLGGEEFLIILQETTQSTAINIAERLRTLIATTPLHYQDVKIPLTVSFGVTIYDTDQDFDQALQASDLLLYQAKKFGRNKVEWQLKN